MLEKYYQILGVTDKATITEIKKAYRQKAKSLHPDINKAPDANEQFILLNEAYEYLIAFKSGRKDISLAEFLVAWEKQQREQARQRAAAHARMKYQEFLKSDFYTSVSALSTVVDHLHVFFSIAILIFMPVIVISIYGIEGLFASLLCLFVTSPVTITGIGKARNINLGQFINAALHVIQTRAFQVVVLFILNIFVIMRVGLHTLIPTVMLFLIFIASIALVFILLKWLMKVKPHDRFYFTYCITPFMLNLFLIANFLFSKNPTQETYHFNKAVEISEIILENHKYAEYYGIRMFLDYEVLQLKGRITYTFEEGLFGIRVMTGYKLHYVS